MNILREREVANIRYFWPKGSRAGKRPNANTPCVVVGVVRQDNNVDSLIVSPIVTGKPKGDAGKYAIPVRGLDADGPRAVALQHGMSTAESQDLYILASEANVVQQPSDYIFQTRLSSDTASFRAGKVGNELFSKVMAARQQAKAEGHLVQGLLRRNMVMAEGYRDRVKSPEEDRGSRIRQAVVRLLGRKAEETDQTRVRQPAYDQEI